MAYLLILTGQRADDVVELSPAATLSLGSSTEAHIQLPEADVAATHAQVYPAQGSYWFQDLGQGHTHINMDRLANATHALRAHDVLALGRTFVKFVTEPPYSQGGVDRSEELGARDREIEQLRERVARLAAKSGELGRELERAREQLEEVRAAESSQELASALAVLEAARAALESLGVPRAAPDLPRGDPHDAAALLDAAGLPPEVQRRVEASLVSYVDRESLRRLSGSALVFERAEESSRIEDELRALRGRASDLAAALVIGRPGVSGPP